MFNAVIYRHNPTLAARVAQAKPDFVHEFPAEFSLEEIQQGLKEVMERLAEVLKKAYDEGTASKHTIHVDGTVLSAGGEELESWRPKLIRQDDVKAYDIYAEHVAGEAKRLAQFGDPMVVIISDRIADHNSEVFDPYQEDVDGVYRMDAEHTATHNWVNRLRKHEVRVIVKAARWFEIESRRDGVVVLAGGRRRTLRDVVVLCDHHNGMQDLIGKCGGTWLNAYPNYSDSDFLSD